MPLKDKMNQQDIDRFRSFHKTCLMKYSDETGKSLEQHEAMALSPSMVGCLSECAKRFGGEFFAAEDLSPASFADWLDELEARELVEHADGSGYKITEYGKKVVPYLYT